MPTTLSFFIFLTMIKPVALSYVCSYLTGLHNGKYCVGLVVNLPAVLRWLFLDFLAIFLMWTMFTFGRVYLIQLIWLASFTDNWIFIILEKKSYNYVRTVICLLRIAYMHHITNLDHWHELDCDFGCKGDKWGVHSLWYAPNYYEFDLLSTGIQYMGPLQ